MDISKIYQTYLQKITAPTTSKINSITNLGSTDTKSDSINATVTDQLNLNSSTPDLTGYLNYGATGNYNSLTDLASLLSSDSSQNNDTTDLFGNSTSTTIDPYSTPNFMDFLSDSSFTDSTDSSSLDSIFNSLAQSNEAYVNQLIQNALAKLDQSNADKNSNTLKTTSQTQISAASNATLK